MSLTQKETEVVEYFGWILDEVETIQNRMIELGNQGDEIMKAADHSKELTKALMMLALDRMQKAAEKLL